YMVEGPSMRPTLVNSERLVVNKFIYRFRQPERGEILVFRYPRDPSRDFIKRVIAVPGDTIEIKDGRVFVNGQLQNETYILERTRGSYPLSTVPAGHVFVMGDNRNNSEDSRFKDVGFVPYDLIKGKAVLVFWPLDHIKSLP
ncbi:MAG: signal peptidase I, partial [Negativicutes bacterium]|nr:signal peptidase I [Negativicutes bacterium]